MKLAHILVATDLSQEAMSCVPQVAGLARTVGARITLLHVLESFEAIPHGSPLAPPLGPTTDAARRDAARTHLEERRAAFGTDLTVEIELVSGGDPAEEITTFADASDVDLIAMTTHGRKGFRRLALGSVAEAVTRQSRKPVLILPLPGT